MSRRHILHVVYSFSIGGLENVIVQLINRLPVDRYEHTVLSLTTISDFKNSKRGAGYDLANGIARVIGKSRDEMEREALAWWEGQGRSVKTKNDPHPNRSAALEFLRPDVPKEVLDRVRAINIDATGDPSRAWWVARIMSEMDLHRVKKG